MRVLPSTVPRKQASTSLVELTYDNLPTHCFGGAKVTIGLGLGLELGLGLGLGFSYDNLPTHCFGGAKVTN